MADSDDKLSSTYRKLASEEPSALIDAAILARARARRPSRFGQWAGPVSIAAVLVLGIGISLRMQLEEPGVETSVPEPKAVTPEVKRVEPAPAASDLAKPAPPPPAKEKVQVQRQLVKPRRDEPAAPAAPPAFVPEPPASAAQAPATAPAAAPAPAQRVAPMPAELGAAAAPQARAKREAAMQDSAGARELRKSLNAAEAETDPARELERIAKLRGEGRHAEADKALEEFRKRHPDFRIPDATWERVRPR